MDSAVVLAWPQLVPTENIQSLNLAFKDIKSLLAWGNRQLPPLKLDLSFSLLDSAGGRREVGAECQEADPEDIFSRGLWMG